MIWYNPLSECSVSSWNNISRYSVSTVQVFTDHKNLLYFKEAWKLNRWQAWWMLDLADYNLKLVHIPGKQLSAPDALSWRWDFIPKEDTDNKGVTILPQTLFTRLVDIELNQKIAKSIKKDPQVLDALKALERETPAPFRSRLSDWKYDAEILTYQGWVFLPDKDDIRKNIIKLHHDHQTTGHPGYLKTQQLISKEYWWLGMAQFIKKYVEGCSICQQNKTNTHLTIPPITPISSSKTLPLKQISYDLITGLPESNGFDALLVVVDHGLSKGVIPCPTKSKIMAEGVASIIFWKLFTQFGLFNKVISDWGPQFSAKFTLELSCILGYQIALSTVYHPQTDGETERVNQEVETYLWIFCGSHPETWVEHIPMVEFVHNHCPHSSTGKSPFYLMMGYEPQALPEIIETAQLPAVEEQLKTLKKARDKALAVHKLTQELMKNQIKSKFTPFKINDKVWLEAWNLKRNIINPKFTPKQEGPFKITKVISPLSYQLQIPGSWKIHPVFHASLLTPYKENEVHRPNFPEPPPDLINEEEEYEIKQILNHQGTSKNHFYLIWWKGYTAEEDMWLKEADLQHAVDILNTYKRRIKHPPDWKIITLSTQKKMAAWLLHLLLVTSMETFSLLLPIMTKSSLESLDHHGG